MQDFFHFFHDCSFLPLWPNVIFRWRIVWIASQQRGLVYALGDLSGGWKQVIKIDIIFQWKIPSLIEIILKLVNLLFIFDILVGKKNYTLIQSALIFLQLIGFDASITHHPRKATSTRQWLPLWPLGLRYVTVLKMFVSPFKHTRPEKVAPIFLLIFWGWTFQFQGVRTFFENLRKLNILNPKIFGMGWSFLIFLLGPFSSSMLIFGGVIFPHVFFTIFHIAPAKGDWNCLLSLHSSSHKRPT